MSYSTSARCLGGVNGGGGARAGELGVPRGECSVPEVVPPFRMVPAIDETRGDPDPDPDPDPELECDGIIVDDDDVDDDVDNAGPVRVAPMNCPAVEGREVPWFG